MRTKDTGDPTKYVVPNDAKDGVKFVEKASAKPWTITSTPDGKFRIYYNIPGDVFDYAISFIGNKKVQYVRSDQDGNAQNIEFIPTTNGAYYFKQVDPAGNNNFWTYDADGLQSATQDSSTAASWRSGYIFEEDTTSTYTIGEYMIEGYSLR
jgi:hypothetical protein